MPTIKVTGLEPLIRALAGAGADAPRFAARALHEEASEAFVLSQAVVPVRYGDLKRSGVVHPPVTVGSKAYVHITYGGPAAPYAVYVHEIPPSRAHHDAPTRWKFLENPVKVYARTMGERMTTRVLAQLADRFGT